MTFASAIQGAATAAAASVRRPTVTPDGADPKKFKGLVTPGNLDIYNRKILHNADGSYSTTSSTSFQDDRTGLEVLIPTVINGVRYSPMDAWQHYLQTGENLGSFNNAQNADRYATLLHNNQQSKIESAHDPSYGALGPSGVQGPSSMNDQFAGLAPVFQKQLQSLIAASHGRVRLVSGYRTLQQQQQLYANAAKLYGESNAAQWVADPAHSNHVKGAAGDLAGDLTLAHQLAPQFGLSFPMPDSPYHVEMNSTRLHSSPLAYTTPPGQPSPPHADYSQSAPHVAASLAESLLPLSNGGLGTAGPNLPFGEGAQAIKAVETASGAQPAAAPQGPDGAATTSAGGANVPGGHGNVSPTQLYGALTQAGIDPAHAAALVSIAGRESGFNTGAFNGNAGTGDKSYGLFQVNLLNGGWAPFLEAHGIANPAQALTTLQGSVAAVKAILGSSGLHPWGGYKGLPWWNGVNLDVGAQASGGAVTAQDMQALGGG